MGFAHSYSSTAASTLDMVGTDGIPFGDGAFLKMPRPQSLSHVSFLQVVSSR